MSFCGGSLGEFPELRRLITHAIVSADFRSLTSYGDPSGDASLRAEISRHIHLGPGGDSLVVVTSGGQHAICLALSALLLDSRKVLLVQQPSFFGVFRAVHAWHQSVRLVPFSDASQLPSLIRSNPGCVAYLTSNHNPEASPCSLSASDKESIAREAFSSGSVVIEDNPYDMTRFDDSVPDEATSVHSIAVARGWSEAVVLIGGFSKIVGAGLRVGFLVHHRGADFAKALRSAKITGSIFTPSPCQTVCTSALSDASYLPALRLFLRSRRDSMLGALSRAFGAVPGLAGLVSWNSPTAGVFVRFAWSERPGRSLVEVCKGHGVSIESSRFSFADDVERPHARLNFAQNEPQAMEEGVRRLVESCCDFFGVSAPLSPAAAPPAMSAKSLNILLTSGGTAVPLDGVRVLTNMSQGTTGAMIAEDLVRAGHRVTFLYARGSRRPFSRNLAMRTDSPAETELARLRALRLELDSVSGRLREVEYYTFAEYLKACQSIVSDESSRPDVGIFAAAVSDFGPTTDVNETTKISSDKGLIIQLGLLPKVISQVKVWNPKIFLVTFKLLVGVSVFELVEVAHGSGLKARSDLVVANSIEPGSHLARRQTVILTPEKGVTTTSVAGLGRDLCHMIERRISQKHWHTVAVAPAIEPDTIPGTLGEPYVVLQDAIARCALLGLWIPYSEKLPYPGADFGFAAIRLPGDGGFLITGRGSSKAGPGGCAPSDIVHVTGVDFGERTLHVRGATGRRASLNANVAAGLFRERPDVNLIIHAHVFPDTKVATSEDFAPGTQEDFDEIVGVARKSRANLIGLVGHGIIVMGKNFDDIMREIGDSHTYNHHPEMYDVIYTRFQSTIKDFAQLVGNSCPDRSVPVLDIAAGTASVSLGLVELGFKDISLCDISSAMLEVACKKLSPILGGQPKMFAMPMQALDTSGASFGVVVCRQAINYAKSVDELRDIFVRVRGVLRTGGKLVFNAPNFAESRRTEYSFKLLHDYSLPSGQQVRIHEANALFATGRILRHVQHCVVTKVEGEHIDRTALFDLNSFTLFTADEFVGALGSAGFSVIETFGKQLVSPCPSDSRTLYVVATK